MSKVGSSSSPSTRTGSGRTNWVRSTLSPAASSGKKTTSPKSSGGKRFVEPYRLSEAQRQSMLAGLEDLSIGDEQSRSLFAAALEYGLATCRKLMEPANESPPPPREHSPSEEEVAIAALAQAADCLAQRLKELDDAASLMLQQELAESDRFQRSYGEDYLNCLGWEIQRVAGVAKPVQREAPQAPEEPPLSDDARRFILSAADAFEDCFEQAPTADPHSLFVGALEAVVQVTGIRVPTGGETLSQVLAQE